MVKPSLNSRWIYEFLIISQSGFRTSCCSSTFPDEQQESLFSYLGRISLDWERWREMKIPRKFSERPPRGGNRYLVKIEKTSPRENGGHGASPQPKMKRA